MGVRLFLYLSHLGEFGHHVGFGKMLFIGHMFNMGTVNPKSCLQSGGNRSSPNLAKAVGDPLRPKPPHECFQEREKRERF